MMIAHSFIAHSRAYRLRTVGGGHSPAERLMAGVVGAGADVVITEPIIAVPAAPVALRLAALPLAGGEVVGGTRSF